MVGKLIKTGNDYLLRDSNDEVLAITSGTVKGRMLSLKNCQAIERGYDLDELAKEGVKFHEQDEIHRPNSEHLYKKGFQKALSILGDNRELIIKLNDLLDGLNSFKYLVKASYLHFDCEEIIKSLQKNEWKVEIEMEKEVGTKLHDDGREFFWTDSIKPKLDADGCLILKRL